jgi:hypothetical protein
MSKNESMTTVIRPVYQAKAVSSVWFPKDRESVYTQNRWSLGRSRDGRWCASNGKGNGLWFRTREALDAYARFLSARDWKVTVVRA